MFIQGSVQGIFVHHVSFHPKLFFSPGYMWEIGANIVRVAVMQKPRTNLPYLNLYQLGDAKHKLLFYRRFLKTSTTVTGKI